jgi:biotin carboxylase
VLVEKFITSFSEHSAEVLIHGGEVAVVAVGEKVKTRGRFRVDLSVRYPAEVDVQQMCSRAVETLGLTRGPAHIEFAITERGPVLIELGARAGGGHTPLLARHVSGVDEAVAICRMATGQDPGPLRPVFRRGAEYRFLTFPPGTLAEAIIPEEVRAHPAVVDVDILVPPGGTLRDVQTGSDRAGFVVTIGETRDDAVRVADWAAGEIRVRYADGEVRRAF